jgi:hypothetical protein
MFLTFVLPDYQHCDMAFHRSDSWSARIASSRLSARRQSGCVIERSPIIRLARMDWSASSNSPARICRTMQSPQRCRTAARRQRARREAAPAWLRGFAPAVQAGCVPSGRCLARGLFVDRHTSLRNATSTRRIYRVVNSPWNRFKRHRLWTRPAKAQASLLSADRSLNKS